jgi:hypothetical protein
VLSRLTPLPGFITTINNVPAVLHGDARERFAMLCFTAPPSDLDVDYWRARFALLRWLAVDSNLNEARATLGMLSDDDDAAAASASAPATAPPQP